MPSTKKKGYNDQYNIDAKCPFYKRDSAQHHDIVCEGPFDTTVSLSFHNTERRRKAWLNAYCYSTKGCEQCWLYKETWRSYE